MGIRRAIVLLGLLAAPAAAQAPALPDAPAGQAEAEAIAACLSAPPVTDDPASCVGVIAESCLTRADGTVDNALRCIAGETAGWQLRLDAALATLRDDAAASDSVAADTPAAEPAAARPSRAAALDRAQSAWLAWLAAECDWHRLGFDPETADVAAAECRRDAIADRVLRLGPRSAAVDGP
ncbi:lysozyme inhibitor LprI family protein [Paracoccus sphaerophysae]|uniref:Lysozyme inhibitor LprI-like N-terminal domain-containing protein n=1 Tax=Paracoccus sphaerophysae TaxID=690417 RepID=A0A099EVH2_9RHOB|nr:lysozyme inhibitor LprI family protein [Paracoccus sphaerophysae]KGJ01918.1 hypothetical protein IC63_15765 [Paracoccus sphaerophysae]